MGTDRSGTAVLTAVSTGTANTPPVGSSNAATGPSPGAQTSSLTLRNSTSSGMPPRQQLPAMPTGGLPMQVWSMVAGLSDPRTLDTLASVSRGMNRATRPERDLAAVQRQIDGVARKHFQADTDDTGVTRIVQVERLLGHRAAPTDKPFVSIPQLPPRYQAVAYRALRQRVANLRHPPGAREHALRLMRSAVQGQLAQLSAASEEHTRELVELEAELRSSLRNFREARKIVEAAAEDRLKKYNVETRQNHISALITVFGRLMDDHGMGAPSTYFVGLARRLADDPSLHGRTDFEALCDEFDDMASGTRQAAGTAFFQLEEYLRAAAEPQRLAQLMKRKQ